MHFPFDNKIIHANDTQDTLKDYRDITEIPFLPHPGAFSCIRKNHIHEGIDLYCEKGDKVVAMEPGVVVGLGIFTGEQVDSPWWNTTWYVMVEGVSGVINYGEIAPCVQLGDKLEAGEVLGEVIPVLKKDKGRPMSMLHLEYYDKGTRQPIKIWSLNTPKPSELKDPTTLLQPFLMSALIKKIEDRQKNKRALK